MASAPCIKRDGVPVELKVAATHFWANDCALTDTCNYDAARALKQMFYGKNKILD